jgi:hypothetical protein
MNGRGKTIEEVVWVWLIVVTLAASAIVVVTRRQRTAAQKYEAARESRCAVTFPLDSKQQDACEHERDSGFNYLPWWYILIAWPEGISVWAIVLTGFFVGWQAYETRKDAKIAHATFVTQFRPKVIVRNISLNPTTSAEYDQIGDGIWKIELTVLNMGETTAHIQKCEASLFLVGDYPTTTRDQLGSKQWPRFTLAPRARAPLEFVIDGDRFRRAFSISEKANRPLSDIGQPRMVYDKSPNMPQATWPTCKGLIEYADDNKAARQTGFQRIWDFRSQKFTASQNPDEEYQD